MKNRIKEKAVIKSEIANKIGLTSSQNEKVVSVIFSFAEYISMLFCLINTATFLGKKASLELGNSPNE